jgi:hypothetical protein
VVHPDVNLDTIALGEGHVRASIASGTTNDIDYDGQLIGISSAGGAKLSRKVHAEPSPRRVPGLVRRPGGNIGSAVRSPEESRRLEDEVIRHLSLTPGLSRADLASMLGVSLAETEDPVVSLVLSGRLKRSGHRYRCRHDMG